VEDYLEIVEWNDHGHLDKGEVPRRFETYIGVGIGYIGV
jgi:hypothetical protein